MRVDIEDAATLKALFEGTKDVDAVVCCAGGADWGPLANLTDGDFILSLRYKLMGQVNVVRAAMDKVKDGGSTRVTSGILATKPMPGSVAVSQVNSGLEGFVSAAGLDMQRGIRMIGAIIALIRADCRRRDCEAARWACELMGTASGKRRRESAAASPSFSVGSVAEAAALVSTGAFSSR